MNHASMAFWSILILMCTPISAMDRKERVLQQTIMTLKYALSNSRFHTLSQARSILRCYPELASHNHLARPMCHAAQTPKAYALLKRFGADFKAEDSDSNTALHTAQNSAITLALLTKEQADPNKTNINGRTPLFFAHTARQVAFLVLGGAHVNALDKFRRTPIYYARTSAVAKSLIAHGALLDIVDKNGETPLQFLKKTNSLIAREIEFYMRKKKERRSIQQPMVWRAVKHTEAPEHKEAGYAQALDTSMLIEQLEEEAQEEEKKVTSEHSPTEARHVEPVIIRAATAIDETFEAPASSSSITASSAQQTQDSEEKSTSASASMTSSALSHQANNTAATVFSPFASTNYYAALEPNETPDSTFEMVHIEDCNYKS